MSVNPKRRAAHRALIPCNRTPAAALPGVYKRGSRYVYSYRYCGQRKWGSAATKNAARKVKAAVETDIRRGDHRAGRDVSFADYAAEWVDTYQGRTSRGLDAQTRAEYGRALRARAVPP